MRRTSQSRTRKEIGQAMSQALSTSELSLKRGEPRTQENRAIQQRSPLDDGASVKGEPSLNEPPAGRNAINPILLITNTTVKATTQGNYLPHQCRTPRIFNNDQRTLQIKSLIYQPIGRPDQETARARAPRQPSSRGTKDNNI